MIARNIWLVVLGAFSLCSAGVSYAADASVEKKYALPEEKGFIQIRVPTTWDDELQQPPQGPPTIAFHARQGQPFEVYVTPMWRTRPDMPDATKDTIRQEVKQAAESAKSQAVEKNIRLVEFSGSSGPGFYFSATDPAPKPDEYKFMTQGMLKVGDLVVTFMVLTNDGQEQVKRDALSMIKSAVHVQP